MVKEIADVPELITAHSGEILAHRYDVQPLLGLALGADWQAVFATLMDREGRYVERGTDHESVLDAPDVTVGLIQLSGNRIARQFPGLWQLYRHTIFNLMIASLPKGAELCDTYGDPDLALDAYEQRSVPARTEKGQAKQRLEAHRDTRYTAILTVEAPPEEYGGRLVIGNDPAARTVEDIMRDPTYLAHKAGTLVCFPRGRDLAHVTEEVIAGGGRRIIVGCNYPPLSETIETARAIAKYIWTRSRT